LAIDYWKASTVSTPSFRWNTYIRKLQRSPPYYTYPAFKLFSCYSHGRDHEIQYVVNNGKIKIEKNQRKTI